MKRKVLFKAIVFSLVLFGVLTITMTSCGARTTTTAATTDDSSFSFLGQTWAPYSPDQVDIWNELERRTGTRIDFIWAPLAEYDQRVNVVLASGDLPDVIFNGNPATLIREYAIIPLDDLLASHGRNITRLFEGSDYLYLRQLIDSKIYHIPVMVDFPPARSMLVRNDWIRQLGVDMPVTYVEWKNVWQLMRDTDLAGPGSRANQVPLMVCEGDGLLNYVNFFGIKMLGNAGGALFAYSPDESRVIGLFDHPDFRMFLEEMRDLYARGILDREFVTRNVDYRILLDSGFAGSTYYFAERARVSTDVIRETFPDAELIGVPQIQSYNGRQLVPAREKMGARGFTITIEAERRGVQNNIMRVLDYMFSDEGMVLLNYGIQGQHHDMVGGRPVIRQDISRGSFTEARRVGLIPSVVPFYFMEDAYLQLLLAGTDPAELPADSSTRFFYDALFLNTPYFYDLMPIFTTEPYVQHQASLRPRLMELYSICVTGQITIEQFYAQYNTVLQAGWQQVIEAQNDTYQGMR